ncbi:MAG: protein kinase [Planctomycetota bacterium]
MGPDDETDALPTRRDETAALRASQEAARSAASWCFGELAGEGEAARPAVEGRLAGRYRIDGVLGEGGMGQVLRAWDEVLARPVAIKLLRSATWSRDTVLRFQREGQLQARLRHPGILSVFGGGMLEGHGPFLVTELIEGARDLRAAWEGQPLARRLELYRGVLEAVAHMHAEGVVHRDLKPANVLVDAAGRPRVTDLGLAWAPGVSALTKSGTALGTPLYMSPEQLAGATTHTPSADVYALGLILFEVLTGSHPLGDPATLPGLMLAQQDAPRPSELCPGIDAALEEVCTAAMRHRVSGRHADAGELLRAFDAALAGGPPPEPRARARRRALLAGALLASGALLAGAAAAWPRAGEVTASPSASSEPEASPPTSPASSPSSSPAPLPSLAGSPALPAPTPTPAQGLGGRLSPERAAAAREEGLRLLHAVGEAQDLARAERLLGEAAAAGDLEAAASLAEYLARRRVGHDAAADGRRAWALLEGHEVPRAWRGLGHLQRLGIGVPADHAAGFALYERAAEAGDAESMFRLVDYRAPGFQRWMARLRAEGSDPQAPPRTRAYYGAALMRTGDLALGWKIIAEAAAKDAEPAWALLCRRFRAEGRLERALPYARRLVAVGHLDGYEALGAACVEGVPRARDPEGQGLGRDPRRALALWHAGAERGDPECLWRVGRCLINGLFVPGDAGGWTWVAAAAQSGHTEAQRTLAFEHLRGRDPARALRARRSFEAWQRQQDPDALWGLGVARILGVGEPKDLPGGVKLLEESVRAGSRHAPASLAEVRYQLGELEASRAALQTGAERGQLRAIVGYARYLRDGVGGPRDLEGARAQYERAAREGHPEAISALRALEK